MLWSLVGWLVLMAYPAWLVFATNPFSGVTWLAWGLQDYRWLIASYLVTVLSTVVLPPLCARLLSTGPPAAIPPYGDGRWVGRSIRSSLVGTAFALAIFAPPWNVERGNGEVGNHDVHLSQLQAIHKGSLPYVGPASVQYGPGSQMLQYAHMSLAGKFTLAGYRESYALTALIGLAVFTSVSVGVLGLAYGLLAAVLALYLSPFAFLGWDGPVFTGFFGWANPFRYMGAFVVMALMPSLVAASRGWRNVPALAAGLVWGAFTWMSQENLSGTCLAAALFLTAAWSLGCCSFAQVRGAVVNAVIGLTAFWLPVLAYYAAYGELSRFVEGYFLISRFVAAGMSNTPWSGETVWTAAFYLTPWFLLAAAWAAIFDLPAKTFAVPLPAGRQRLLALVCLSLACFTAALFRKDSSHFVNVLIGLPAVMVALAKETPRITPRWLPRLLLIGSIVALATLFPTHSRMMRFVPDYLRYPWARFWNDQPPLTSAWAHEPGPAFRRAGDFVSGDYRIYTGAMPARAFFETMNEVSQIVGDRAVFVHSFPRVPPEIVYFFADLRPGPILFNVSTMVFHTGIQQRFLRHMEEHCREIEAIVGTDAMTQEVALFRRCHSMVVEIPKVIDGSPYVIWLAAPSG